MIWAAIQSDAARLWRALTRNPVADIHVRLVMVETVIGAWDQNLRLNHEALQRQIRELNDRIVALEIERASAPPAEPEPDIATSWQRARARAEHG